MARELARPLNAKVFNFRTVARGTDAPPLPPSTGTDPRGEYSDTVVEELLRAAIVNDALGASGRPVIAVGLPSTAAQVNVLYRVARTFDLPLAVIEFDAINATVMAQAYHRRLCLSCRPDPDGEPHDWAYPGPEMPFRCDTCHGPLSIRRADQPATYLARLARYRERRPSVLTAADVAGIPWALIYSTTISSNVAMALRLLTVTNPQQLAVRDRRAADGVPSPRSGAHERLEGS